MQIALRWMLGVVVAGVVTACSTPATGGNAQPTTAPTVVAKLVPGARVGDVVLTTIAQPDPAMPAMTDPCNAQNTGQPGAYTFTCSIKASPNLWLGLGWSNPPEQLESDWNAMTWQAYFEDQEIDLPAFGTFDIAITGSDHRLRGWNVAIANPVPRTYTLRMVTTITKDLNGASVGTYDFTYNITVTE